MVRLFWNDTTPLRCPVNEFAWERCCASVRQRVAAVLLHWWPGTKRGGGVGREKVRDQSPTGRPLCIATRRAEPTDCSESRCVYVRYQTTDILRVQSTIILVCVGVRGKQGKKRKRLATYSLSFSWNRPRGSWQPTLLTCSSSQLDPSHDASFSHSAKKYKHHQIQGKAHKFIVDLWPQLKSFRLDWATKYIYVQYKQQSPANYIVDDVIHLSPLSPCCLLSIY
jgi:hypothetical protein